MASIVLSIGTTHPWNVAGVGRDLVVGCALQARVFTAIAAISAQDAGGVVALRPVAADLDHINRVGRPIQRPATIGSHLDGRRSLQGLGDPAGHCLRRFKTVFVDVEQANRGISQFRQR